MSTTSATARLPLSAVSYAEIASSLAALALSELFLTAVVNSSMDVAVSSSDADWAAVRRDKSALPAAICPEAAVIPSDPFRTLPTISANP